MAQQYQVDIVTKVQGVSTVAKLDAAIQSLAKNQQKVDTAANKAAGSQKKFANAAATSGSKAKGAAIGVKSLAQLYADWQATYVGAITGVAKAVADRFQSATGCVRGLKKQLDLTRQKNMSWHWRPKLHACRISLALVRGDSSACFSYNGRLGQLGFGLKETVDVYTGFNAVARKSLPQKMLLAPCFSSHRLLVAAD